MNFILKTEDDPENENGYTISETCEMCKWYIEKGNYYMQLGCNHRFHKKCMEVHLLQSSRCVVCDREAEMSELFVSPPNASQEA